jgi:hypothetical protein
MTATLFVNIDKRTPRMVATITKQSPAADTYQSQLPWLLLLNDGRIRRFPSMSEAKDEAQKRFAPCSFSRT